MLSFLYKIKNNIRNKLKSKHSVSRTRQHEVVNRMLNQSNHDQEDKDKDKDKD